MAQPFKTPSTEKRSSSEAKWSSTNNEARTIMEKEAVARERKTERLKAQRLAMEAETPEVEVAKATVRKPRAKAAKKGVGSR
ncbi:hypothetical protein [Rhizobium sp. EC-SD404]|uniref:hypothetical protein n=1 Tax=Rhizobium sp. EC-SD404 TaxID=2038389 RepID=UPI001257C701|nr:hypothetical protein [Rhizobium sp. EC-SD404]VVT23203.1 conserved hypothetical protein [Rhizobium sp. EC-SD404]